MARLDLTVTQYQHGKMMVVLDGVRSKLSSNKEAIQRVCSQDEGKAKLKAFAKTPSGRWLKEIARFRRELNEFFDEAGLEQDDGV